MKKNDFFTEFSIHLEKYVEHYCLLYTQLFEIKIFNHDLNFRSKMKDKRILSNK